MYFTDNRAAQIIGNTTVKEGDVLNLTYSVDSFPPSLIVWSKLGSDTNLHNGTGSATIFIQNVKPDHSGQYICTVTYMNNTLKENVTITVICKYHTLSHYWITSPVISSAALSSSRLILQLKS